MIEEPKIKSSIQFDDEDFIADEDELRTNDKVFEEIRQLKNIFPERMILLRKKLRLKIF